MLIPWNVYIRRCSAVTHCGKPAIEKQPKPPPDVVRRDSDMPKPNTTADKSGNPPVPEALEKKERRRMTKRMFIKFCTAKMSKKEVKSLKKDMQI